MKNIESVLLIEDDDVTNFISKRILEGCGINKIDVATDGEKGVEHLKKQCPDLSLLDISMPRMDGFQLLEAMKKIHLCPKTKIVMLTSSSRPEDKEKALSYPRVVGYIEKPLTQKKIEELLAAS